MASVSLEDVQSVDLSKVPVEEVFQTLKCDRKGLSSAEGEGRLKAFGPNKLEEKSESKLLKFLGFMWNPLSWVMEMAAIMAIALANGGGRPPDWQDFVGILCNMGAEAEKKVHALIDGYADRGLRSLGVSYQQVPERNKDGAGDPWQFIGLLPLFDPPRHDSAETIRRAQHLGVNVKMITGDQLAIGKETGRRLGMGTNMYPSTTLLGDKNSTVNGMHIDELIEKADGFAGVFPEHKYEIVKRLQDRKHICGMTGDGVNDAPALKKADIGIAFDFAPFMVLIIAILNDGTIMTISKDRVKPSPTPDSWKLNEIFATGIVLGTYMALVTALFFYLAHDTDFFTDVFGVMSIKENDRELMAALYLQVSIISQALIFVTRSRSWSFVERPGFLLLIAFFAAQLVATSIAVYADWEFCRMQGIGWGWGGAIWVFSVVTYVPLDVLKFMIRYALNGPASANAKAK
ncbi:hypothetical protein EJB05_57221 [Eragrostis curvula]|uniref:Cation-transporting P-type ATPase N-terminal domain-containing protein n=1 Tax=Eragrostis curvula TaxID=38414 RepID=A0A5J9SDZ8_9POAL|nr:hypothetical protein EJB05_57221 [Eragrostis curvula]